VEPLTRGLPPPDPHSLCPFSTTTFVEPPEKIPGVKPTEKIPGVTPPPKKKIPGVKPPEKIPGVTPSPQQQKIPGVKPPPKKNPGYATVGLHVNP
jgi:hypothetical protein